MLSKAEIADAAVRLHVAEQTRVQTGLLSIAHPEMTMDDAYAVQAAYVALRHAQGRKTIGWKIGLTSKAMQYALNIATPDSGVLLDDMAFEDGATIPADRFIQPRDFRIVRRLIGFERSRLCSWSLRGLVPRQSTVREAWCLASSSHYVQ